MKWGSRISKSNKHTVRKSLRQWEAICRSESLGYFPEDEEKVLVELSILLTYYMMDGPPAREVDLPPPTATLRETARSQAKT